MEAGATLAIMEAMKMEHAIKAPSAGTVTDVFYNIGDLVDGGADLLTFEAAHHQTDVRQPDAVSHDGFYAGVGFRALGHKVFPEKFRLSVAQKVLWG